MQSKLVEDNLVIARKLAAKFYNNRGHLEFDEILSFATMGLVDAASRFDPSRGLKFTTFAGPRIVGSILDGLRKEYGHGKRRRKPINATFEPYQERNHGKSPTDFEQLEKLAKLRESFHILTPMERLAVEQKLDGLSYREIACSTGYSKTYFWNLEQSAIEKLREHLGRI